MVHMVRIAAFSAVYRCIGVGLIQSGWDQSRPSYDQGVCCDWWCRMQLKCQVTSDCLLRIVSENCETATGISGITISNIYLADNIIMLDS